MCFFFLGQKTLKDKDIMQKFLKHAVNLKRKAGTQLKSKEINRKQIQIK